MREPVLLPFCALAAGVGLSRLASFRPVEAYGITIGFVLLALLAWWRGGYWVRFVSAGCAVVAFGIALDVLHRPGPPPELDAQNGETVLLTGCVVDPPVLGRDRERFLLELGPRAIASVSMMAKRDAPPLNYGQRVEIEAKIRLPHNYHNPGAFDYAAYLSRQNIFWYASMPRDGAVRIMPGRCGSRLAGVVFGLRTAALDRIERLYAGNDYATAMMEAILIGQSAKLEKVWTDHFRRTGTYHALVISGLHVTVLAGVLLFLLRMCMTGELTALLIACAAAWVYAAVSGWSAPVNRAAGGFTLYLIGRFFFRRGRALNLLAVIAFLYVCFDPGQLFDPSFQLSFLSVAALGAVAAPILERTSGLYTRATRFIHDRNYDLHIPREAASARVEMRLIAETVALWTRVPERITLGVLAWWFRLLLWMYEMFLISAVIQFALALAMVLYFHRVSLTGLTANLIIVPLMTAVVPIGFAAIFTGWHWLATVAGWLLVGSEWVAAFHARFEPQWRMPDPPFWLSVAFAAGLILLAWTLRRGGAVRWAAAGATGTLLAIMIWSPFAPQLRRGQLELTVVDVGQGDALFVAFPDGSTMLADGGGIPTFGRAPKPRIDIGEDVVSPYLWTRGITHIDVIASTHSHDDHCGGLPALMRNFRPREFWAGANAARLEQTARELGIRIREPHTGDSFAFGGTKIDVLSPAADYVPPDKPANNDSLVMRIRFGQTAFLLTGDIDGAVESQIAPELGHIDVLKIAHHGGRKSTTAPLLETARPEFAVVSAGFGNMFGHPHPDVVSGWPKRMQNCFARIETD